MDLTYEFLRDPVSEFRGAAWTLSVLVVSMYGDNPGIASPVQAAIRYARDGYLFERLARRSA